MDRSERKKMAIGVGGFLAVGGFVSLAQNAPQVIIPDPKPALVAPGAASEVEADLSPKATSVSAPDRNKAQSIDDYPLVSQASAMSAKQDGVAMLLNLNGELCAKTISAEPRQKKGTFTVICETSRSGAGVIRYAFDATNGTARRI